MRVEPAAQEHGFLLEFRLHEAQHPLRHLVERGRLEPDLARPGKVEELADNGVEPQGLLHDDVGQPLVARRHLADPAGEDLGGGADDAQRVLDLVGDRGHHLAERGQPLRLAQLLLELQPLLGPLGHDAVGADHDQAEDGEEDAHDGQRQHDHPPLQADDGLQVVGQVLDHLDHAHDLTGVLAQPVLLAEGHVGLERAEDLGRAGQQAEQGAAGDERRVVFALERLMVLQPAQVALAHELGHGRVGDAVLARLVDGHRLDAHAAGDVGDDPVEPLVLLRVGQGDAAVADHRGQDELDEHLAVEVVREQP